MKALLVTTVLLLFAGVTHSENRMPAGDARPTKNEVPAESAAVRGPLPGDFQLPTAPQGRNDDTESAEHVTHPTARDDSKSTAPPSDKNTKTRRDRDKTRAR